MTMFGIARDQALAAALCAGLFAAAAAVPSARADAGGGVRVECSDPGDPAGLYDSRAAVLWTPSSGGREILVASAHAFRASDGTLRDCRVRAPGGPRRLSSLVLSPADGPLGEDWAVLTLDGRLPADIRRWRLPEDEGGALSLMERDGRLTLYAGAEAARDCLLLGVSGRMAGGASAPRGSVIHDCPERGGVSGAPLSAGAGEEARLVAVYVGRMSGDGAGELGVAQPVTGAFARAIALAMAGD
ncbi:hypothetical protein FKB34_04965 [Glycocaulis profundi]|nr:hypothetical protein FKB34_04965 [Glycocaulis profundi]